MKIHLKDRYKTGEVAQICGLPNARHAAKKVDDGEIDGEMVQSQFQRRTTRQVPLKSLIKFMREKKIPLNGLSEEVDSLMSQTSELEGKITRSGQRGVLSRVNGLARSLLKVIKNLDPIDTLSGVSEDRRTIMIFQELIEVMKSHINVRGEIARISRKRRK